MPGFVFEALFGFFVGFELGGFFLFGAFPGFFFFFGFACFCFFEVTDPSFPLFEGSSNLVTAEFMERVFGLDADPVDGVFHANKEGEGAVGVAKLAEASSGDGADFGAVFGEQSGWGAFGEDLGEGAADFFTFMEGEDLDAFEADHSVGVVLEGFEGECAYVLAFLDFEFGKGVDDGGADGGALLFVNALGPLPGFGAFTGVVFGVFDEILPLGEAGFDLFLLDGEGSATHGAEA